MRGKGMDQKPVAGNVCVDNARKPGDAPETRSDESKDRSNRDKVEAGQNTLLENITNGAVSLYEPHEWLGEENHSRIRKQAIDSDTILAGFSVQLKTFCLTISIENKL